MNARPHQAGETGRDRGSAAVSIAIVFPAVALLFLALVQAVMVSVAQDVALAAAEEGLRVARAHRGTHAQGHIAAAGFARREPVLLSPVVTVSGTTTIAVRVAGHAPSVLPGMRIAVTQTARGARERFTTPRQP
ncbi:pilus assembly protein [Actinomadura craniellae]|uniref:Pilus assembly protein n=1 Tax=Actinomadura craniellae TaxID=2231787 RepID=A0A365H1P5_9ACTN|nr:pilus assembly protein [Actinomadura craniellae]RAY12958.1 pilus assembly protein [Actinomadura craniellae]